MNKINVLASLITEDPDVSADADTITEWWMKSQAPVPDPANPDAALAALVPRGNPRALADIKMEFEGFQRHTKLPPDKALPAFIYFKKHKRLPPDMVRDSAELDQLGGSSDFLPHGRV